jgi:hypothetical protein
MLTLLGILAWMVIVLFVGFYLAADLERYIEGVLRPLPIMGQVLLGVLFGAMGVLLAVPQACVPVRRASKQAPDPPAPRFASAEGACCSPQHHGLFPWPGMRDFHPCDPDP